MAATALPFLAKSVDNLEWGIHCIGCDSAGTDVINDSHPFYALVARMV
jgi:hypothetical protein